MLTTQMSRQHWVKQVKKWRIQQAPRQKKKHLQLEEFLNRLRELDMPEPDLTFEDDDVYFMWGYALIKYGLRDQEFTFKDPCGQSRMATKNGDWLACEVNNALVYEIEHRSGQSYFIHSDKYASPKK